MRPLLSFTCLYSSLLLHLLVPLPFTTAQRPIWSGMHADASRSNMGQLPGPLAASPVLIRNVSFPNYGKSHGTPAIDSRGRIFAVFWCQGPGKYGTPLLRRWDIDGSVHDVTLPAFGSDIIQDSNDALLLSELGIAYISISYYNPSAGPNCTSLFAVHCDDGAVLWSILSHPFIDAMAMHAPYSSSAPVLLALSSQSRQLLMYDALAGTLSAATPLHDYASGRSSMAVSNDGSVAVIQERDDTFGHNKIAVYRCA
jgi:hypothetical protein